MLSELQPIICSKQASDNGSDVVLPSGATNLPLGETPDEEMQLCGENLGASLLALAAAID